MVTIPFTPFEPDKSRFNGGAMPETINVRPVADGWAPLPKVNPSTPAIEYLTDELTGETLTTEDGDLLVVGIDGEDLPGEVQLPGACLGSIFARTDNGVTRAFFGTQTAIYEYDFTNFVFIDVSGPDAPYSVAANARWSFEKFGSSVYAQNGTNFEQVIDLVSGTVFARNPTAPICYYLKTVGSFLVRGRIADEPSTVQWPALENPASNDAGLDGSDIQVLPVGNGVTGIVPMNFGAVVFCRDAIHQMNFALSSDFIFTFNPITEFRGAIAPYAICSIGQNDFLFYAADGFFRGAAMAPIGAERVDKWFLAQTDEAARLAMTSAADYRRKIVWFRYQNSAEQYRLLGYQWQLDRWCQSDADLSEMLGAESPGITIDGLDAIYPTIDDIDVPFDSSSLDGGATEFSGITTDGYFAFLNGGNMQATISTNELSLNGPKRAMVNGGRLMGDAINPSVTVSTTEYQGGDFWERPATTPTARTRNLGLRADGRTHKFKTVVPEDENWSIMSGLDLDVVGSGKS